MKNTCNLNFEFVSVCSSHKCKVEVLPNMPYVIGFCAKNTKELQSFVEKIEQINNISSVVKMYRSSYCGKLISCLWYICWENGRERTEGKGENSNQLQLHKSIGLFVCFTELMLSTTTTTLFSINRWDIRKAFIWKRILTNKKLLYGTTDALGQE